MSESSRNYSSCKTCSKIKKNWNYSPGKSLTPPKWKNCPVYLKRCTSLVSWVDIEESGPHSKSKNGPLFMGVYVTQKSWLQDRACCCSNTFLSGQIGLVAPRKLSPFLICYCGGSFWEGTLWRFTLPMEKKDRATLSGPPFSMGPIPAALASFDVSTMPLTPLLHIM